MAEAEATVAERIRREEAEMTFHPKIDQKSAVIATMMGRDGSKVREAVPRKVRDHAWVRMVYNRIGLQYTALFVLAWYYIGSSI